MKAKLCIIADNGSWSATELKSKLQNILPHQQNEPIALLDFSMDFDFQKRVDEILKPLVLGRIETASLLHVQYEILKSSINQYTSEIARAMNGALISPDEPNLNPWYLGLVHEKNPHKSRYFFELSAIGVIGDHLDANQIGHLILAVQSDEIRRTVISLCSARGIKVTELAQFRRKSMRTRLRDLILESDFLSALSPWLKYVGRKLMCSLSPRSKAGTGKIPSATKTAFVTYFPYFDDTLTTVESLHNHFVPGLEKVFAAHHINPLWLAIYIPFGGISYSQSLRKARDLKRQNIHVEFLEQHLRPRDFINAWWLWFEVHRRAQNYMTKRADLFDRSKFLHLTPDLWKTSFMRSIVIQGILQYLAFKRFFGKNPQLRKLFYICEMQAWEKAMLMATDCFQNPPESIAIQHASISTGYLNYFYDKEENTPSPKQFLTNSPWVQSRLETFLPRVSLVEALRLNYLTDAFTEDVAPRSRIYFSVFTSLSPANTITLLQFLKQAFGNQPPPFQILLKLHPSLNVDLSSLLFPGLVITSKTAAEVLNESFGCLVPDSTVALEALAFGVPCLTPLFSNDISLSPILDFENLGGRVTSPDDLQTQANNLFQQRNHVNRSAMKEQLSKIWKLDQQMLSWKSVMADRPL